MKPVGEIIKPIEKLQQTEQRNTTTPSRPSMPSHWVVEIHARLQARYGNKWTSQYPTEDIVRLAVTEWAQILGTLTPDEVKRGLTDWEGEWPPTVYQFKQACRPRVAAAHKPIPKTPPRLRDRFQEHQDRVQAQLEAMRKAAEIAEAERAPPQPSPDYDWFKARGWKMNNPGEEDLRAMKEITGETK